MAGATAQFREDLIAMLSRLKRFALVLSRSHSDADDLLQATCERALVRHVQFKPGSRMDSWLFSIMHSIWKNEVRQRATHQRVHHTLSLEDRYEDGVRTVTGKISLAEVLSLLNDIEPDQAAALSLVGLDGHSYREAAKVLDIPQGTLESRIARGRIALGRMLDDTEDQTDALAVAHRDAVPTINNGKHAKRTLQ